MKIFLDCSDAETISNAFETGLIDGVTTNPSLMLKAGQDPIEVIKEISNIFPSHEKSRTRSYGSYQGDIKYLSLEFFYLC